MTAKWKLVGLLWLLQFVNYLDRANISIAGPSISRDLHLTPAGFGWVLAAFSVGYALFQIPGGLLADRFGARVMLLMAPIVWSVIVGATALATSLTMLVGARLLFGMAEGSSNASLYKVVGAHFPPHERGLAQSIWVTAYAIGPAFAAPFVALLITTVGWRGMFFGCAIPGFLVALLLAIALPSTQPIASPARQKDEMGLRELMCQGRTWVLFCGAFLFNISYWGMLGWLPTYLNMARGLDLKAMGWAASIPYLAGAVGLVVIGLLDRRIFHQRRSRMIAACYTLAAVCLGVAFAAATPVQSIAGLSGAAFFVYGALGSLGAIVISLAPDRARGSFAGLISTGTQLSGVVAPIVIGFVVRETGSFAGGFAFMIATLLLASVCFLILDREISSGSTITASSELRTARG